ATSPRRPSSGLIAPSTTAKRISPTFSLTPSSCATRTIRASPRSAGRLACQHRRRWIGGHDLCAPPTRTARGDLKKFLASVRVEIYSPEGPDFKLLPP